METPEIDKLRAVQSESQAQGNFLEWLFAEKELVLAQYSGEDWDHRLWPITRSISDLLAEYHGIDLNKVEKEKLSILEAIRARP